MGSTAARIEERIRQAVPHIERVLLHPEQREREETLYGVPLADASGTLTQHFGEAPLFAFMRVRRGDRTIIEQQTLPNPFLDEEKAKGIRVAEWLVGHKVDVVILGEALQGKGPEYVFDDAGVVIEMTKADQLLKAIAVAGRE
jgi:predicted Fe-Mo cluster-binding NifX family protein